MRVPHWRPIIATVALATLVAAGGAYAYVNGPGAPAGSSSAAAPASSDTALATAAFNQLLGSRSGTAAKAPGARARKRGEVAILARLRATVHLEATLDLPKKGLVTVAVDHGTVASASSSSVSVSEATGQTVQIAVDSSTKVRKGRQWISPARLAQGDQVFVLSMKSGSGFTALRIVVVMPRPAAGASPSPTAAPTSGSNG